MKSSRRVWPWAMLVVVFAVHTFQAARLFPSLASIVDRDSPVIVVDHAIHEHHGALGARFVRENGTSWGYDPYFLAGYPETPVWDSSSNPSILFDVLSGARAGDYRGYKVGLFVTSVLGLAAVSVGAWAAGLSLAEVAWATVFACALFWLGFPMALWRSGLFAFIAASMGVGLLLGLCVRFDRFPSKPGWLAMAGVGSGLFYVHVTAPVLAGGGLLAFYLSVARRHGWRWHASVFAAAALAGLVNLPWLRTLWNFRSIRTGSGLFMTSNSPWFLVDYYSSLSIDGRLGLVLIALGLVGLVVWLFQGRRPASAAFGGSIVALILLTGFGSFWGPTRTLEPLRFRVAFGFLLAVPAASTLITIHRWIVKRVGGRKGVAVAALGWGLVVGTWVSLDYRFFQACGITLATRRPLVVGFQPEMRQLVRWLKENTDLSARILLEDQLRLMEATDPESVHWTPLLPDMLGKENPRMFIGGLYQTAFIHHHDMAAFGDFQLGDRPIDEWTPAQAKQYCQLYNIGWVVCWSPLSRFWFDRFDGARRVAVLPRYATPDRPPPFNEHEWRAIGRRAGPEVARRYLMEGESSYAIYKLERPHSYFLKGAGRVVSVEPNRVELADVTMDPSGSAVLSLHWLDTWQTDPPTALKPEPASTDPVDFIRIEAKGPLPRLLLFNSYRPRHP